MKKNGFIATSILYTFFLVFVSLFIALVTNYLHNRILLSQIEDASRKTLSEINNTKITDLKVGDHIKFSIKSKGAIIDSNGELIMNSSEHVLNEDATWIVAYITTNGNSKTYYFLSDLTAQKMDVVVKIPPEKIPKVHIMSVDIYNYLKSTGVYNSELEFSGFNFNLPTASFLSLVRNSNIDEEVKRSILNTNGSYVVYVDTPITGLDSSNRTVSYDIGYYDMRAYSFDISQNALIPQYCGGSFNGTNALYSSSNTFGYINVVRDTAMNQRYVNYCYYASPVAYTHNASDNIVMFNENKENDKIISAYSATYNYRLVADITLDVNREDTYIAGGRGTQMDPYLLTNGRKQS